MSLTTITAPLLAAKSLYSMPQDLVKSSTLIEDFEDFTEWTVNHGSAADDAVNYKEGTQSVELTTDVADEGELQKYGVAWPALGTDKQLRLWFYIDDISLLHAAGTHIEYWDSDYVDRLKYAHYKGEGWNLLHIGQNNWSVIGEGSLDNIMNRIRIRNYGAVGSQGVISYDAMYQAKCEPAIILSFDDGLDDVYDKAWPIMRRNNMVGTAYVVEDWVGGANQMTWAELVELQTAGWCIGNHSKTHTNFATLTEAEIETELTSCKDAMVANGITGNGPYHVAYPGGGWDADTLAAMADTNMLTGRTIDQAYCPALPFERPYEIPRLFDLDNGTSLATAKSKIDDICDSGFVACVYGHVIDDAAGASTWAESDFIELCNYIAQKRLVNLTIDEAYQLQSGSQMVRRAG
jgi:peptidoglycan/xylan/chitin deacetylase (PgdA/CDA1 family)